MKKLFVMVALAAVVAGCAKTPESIAPAYVSENLYRDFDCGQLAEEQRNIQSALAMASQQQSSARTNDIVGIVLLGLPVSTLSGDNVAYQVADLKGHTRAIQQSMVRKRCSRGTAHGLDYRAGGTSSFDSRVTAAVDAVNRPIVAPAEIRQAGFQPARPAGVRPLPGGGGIAQPVNYTADEILAYCRAGWESRQLTDGTVEYNPCYYQ